MAVKITNMWDSPYAIYITNIGRHIETYEFDFWNIFTIFACLWTFLQNI